MVIVLRLKFELTSPDALRKSKQEAKCIHFWLASSSHLFSIAYKNAFSRPEDLGGFLRVLRDE
jgi:prenyltransferase beta subunit